jgi:hypothetical protein
MAGNDEMPNGAEHRVVYTDALTAQLGERVTNLNRRQSDLENDMRSGFKQIESSMSAMSSEMRSSVAALATNMAERNKPQWQALGVALTSAPFSAAWPIGLSTRRRPTSSQRLELSPRRW